jgi:hypothetical protein
MQCAQHKHMQSMQYGLNSTQCALCMLACGLVVQELPEMALGKNLGKNLVAPGRHQAPTYLPTPPTFIQFCPGWQGQSLHI